VDDLNTEIEESQETDKCEKHGEYQYTRRVMLGKVMPHKCPKCQQAQADERESLEKQQEQARHTAKVQRMFNNAMLPRRFTQKGFDSYIATTDDQHRALAISKKYAAMWKERFDQGGGMILCGMPGTGKTHLAAAIAISVLSQGSSVVFTSVMKLARDIKSTYSRDSERSEADVIDKYITPELLIIDEVGVQYGSEAEKIILFEVLNGRYEEVLPTIILSNLPIDKLPEYLGDRVVDRMTEGGGAIINFNWESYRRMVKETIKKPPQKEYDPDGSIAAQSRILS